MASRAPSLLNAPYTDPETPALRSPVQPERAPCLILNPRSFRASRADLAGRARRLALAHGAEVIEADTPALLNAGLDRCLADGPRRIIVLAGDGTVQAIAEHLAVRAGVLPSPWLVILGGGRTNLTAADLGGRGRLLQKLQAELRRTDAEIAGRIVEYRPVLRIEQAPSSPRQGFFVAAAMIDDVIRQCHDYRQAARGCFSSGHLATFWCLLRLTLLSLIGRSPLPPSSELDIDAPGNGHLHGAARVLIATTLAHREGAFNPYADRGEGPLRLTAVSAAAPGFWRRLPRILLGRFSERMGVDQGYLSGRCEYIELRDLRRYTLDGEKFDADPARPVLIRAGERLRCLRP
jgi:diacylglycerol kinase family enzyme